MPNQKGLFLIRSSEKNSDVKLGEEPEKLEAYSKEEGNFIAQLAYTVQLVQSGKLEESCQLHLDVARDVLQLLDENEDVQLDFDDCNTLAAIEMMAMSAYEHYLICDFEMAINLGEIVMDIDKEDHFGVLSCVIYSYAASGDIESTDQLLPFYGGNEMEKELLTSLALFKSGKSITLSPELCRELKDEESEISKKTAHLWVEFENFKENI